MAAERPARPLPRYELHDEIRWNPETGRADSIRFFVLYRFATSEHTWATARVYESDWGVRDRKLEIGSPENTAWGDSADWTPSRAPKIMTDAIEAMRAAEATSAS